MVNFVLKNKLLFTTLASLPNLIKPNTLPGYESYCTQDTLTIKIPYANEKTSELLNFSAGTCTGSGESSLIHTYSYNSTEQYGTFEIQIDECGLDNNASTESDGEGGERESYSAVANITLGVTDNGRELVFYNALLGAACGETDDYTVTFTYSSDIDVNGDIECEVDADGNCIVPAYKRYNFEITEFESGAYQTEVTDETRQTIANEMIYLKLSSSDLPGYKKFAIKSCQVQRGDETYEIFNPSQGVCSNDFIDLNFGYDVTYGNGGLQTEAMIQHKLFLLGNQNSDQVYSLSCEIKVCDRNNGTSECNEWSACLDTAGQEEYVCDAEMESYCVAENENSSCEVDNNEGVCVSEETGGYPQEVIDAFTYYQVDNSDKQIAATLVWRVDCNLNLRLYEPDGDRINTYDTHGINSYGIDYAFTYEDGNYIDEYSNGGHDFAIDNIGVVTAESGDYTVKVMNYCDAEVDAQLYLKINGVLSVYEITVLQDYTQYATISINNDRRSQVGSNVEIQSIKLDGADIDETDGEKREKRQKKREQNN